MSANCKFKEIKKMVDMTIRMEKAPTRKQLRESSERPVAEADDGALRLFRSGYAYYTDGENETVVDICNCYDTGYVSVTGMKSEVTPEVLDETEWSIVFTMRGEEQLFRNRMNRKGDRKGNKTELDRETDDNGKRELAETAPDPLDRILLDELVDDLLGTLTDRQREIITSYFFEGLSHTEIAAHLGIKRQSVEATLNRALKKLRKR